MAPLDTLLDLAYLQDEYYARALAALALLAPGDPLHAAVTLLQTHQAGHIAQLAAVGAANPRPTPEAFHFAGGGAPGAEGPFAAAFDDVDTFLRFAQLLEDVTVRAYKTHLDALRGDAARRSTAVRIQATDARHAAMIRRFRGPLHDFESKPWVTGVSFDFRFPADPVPADGPHSELSIATLVYGAFTDPPGASASEDNLVHGPLNLSADFDPDASTEAFDEPLPAADVDAFLALFLTRV